MADIKKIKPSLPKGTRDFLPEEVAKRNYIFDTIKGVFRKYGFQQIDTPAFERLETLTGKYGEEGDRLLFKILNSGDPFKDIKDEEISILLKQTEVIPDIIIGKYIDRYKNEYLEKIAMDFKELNSESTEAIKNLSTRYSKEIQEIYKDEIDNDIKKEVRKIASKLTEKGLRYDLTVPLARYVVQHNGELTFPFRRFHIGPVWRADRPQKGRYQEFYQCDADIIGSSSITNEIELTQIYDEVFKKLGIDVIIRINHRKVMEAFFATFNYAVSVAEALFSVIDKYDKIGESGVKNELGILGIEAQHQVAIMDFISNNNALEKFDKSREATDSSKTAYEDLNIILTKSNSSKVKVDQTLMRGLGYYTGVVWEISLNKENVRNKDVQMGSIGGGGRYDNLTEMFGGRDLSGVGISFGIERIYDVMEELQLFPAELGETTRVLFVHFDEVSEAYGFEQLQKVRAADIASEIYPGKKKLDKQMSYANDKKIPYVVVIGGDEMASGKLTLKNMASGEQEKITIEEIIEKLK